MKVFIMDPIDAGAVELLSRTHVVVDYPASRENDWRSHADAVVVRTFEIRAPDLAHVKKLRIVAKHGTGVDNLDVEALNEAGIIVTNTPGANAAAVAEYALAVTLALSRKVTIANRAARMTVPTRVAAGMELGGKTIGILGFGDIGRRTARLFRSAFDTKLLVYDPYAPKEALTDFDATQVACLHELLPLCDVVSLHLPLSPETRNLIGASELALMRGTALLINVARGGIVNETALYGALVGGQIAGAASDVFDSEPVDPSHPLLTLENFIASPHIAASSKESLVRMGTASAIAVLEALAGRTPPHLVLPKSNISNVTA